MIYVTEFRTYVDNFQKPMDTERGKITMGIVSLGRGKTIPENCRDLQDETVEYAGWLKKFGTAFSEEDKKKEKT